MSKRGSRASDEPAGEDHDASGGAHTCGFVRRIGGARVPCAHTSVLSVSSSHGFGSRQCQGQLTVSAPGEENSRMAGGDVHRPLTGVHSALSEASVTAQRPAATRGVSG